MINYYLRQVYCFRSMCVCLSVCLSVCLCVRNGPVNQTSLKRLKIRTTARWVLWPEVRRGVWCASSIDELFKFIAFLMSCINNFYLRQVNQVNGGDTVFVLCVCLCVFMRSGPVNQTNLERLTLPTSNLTCMFPTTVRTWPLKFFRKVGRGQGHVTPKFLGVKANSSKTVKAADF